MAPFQYVTSINRYRDMATGRFVSLPTLRAKANAIVNASQANAADLAAQFSNGIITAEEWRLAMRERLKQDAIQQYVLGRGGREQMTQQDWGRTGRALRDQYAFVDNMAAEMEAGNLTEGQIRSRSQNIVGSCIGLFERGRGAAFGINLPRVPRDGTTICVSGCQCHWRIETISDGSDGVDVIVEATWLLGIADHCETCIERSQAWTPIRFVNGVAEPFPSIDA